MSNSETLPKEYVIRKFYEYGYGATYSRGNNTYSCSCPICHEGRSFGKKKRCFYIPDKDLIYCHNCGWSSKPMKWIQEAGNMSYGEIMDDIKAGDYNLINLDREESFESLLSKNISHNVGLPEDAINLSNQLELNYYATNSVVQKALRYIHSRKLDTAVNRTDLFLSLDDPVHSNRIIIPFKDIDGKIQYYQSRAFGGNADPDKEKIKYLSSKGGSRSIFGLDKLAPIGKAYITEGPIDAMFIQNGLGVAGITTGSNTLTPTQKEQLDFIKLSFQFIWCLDSQWIDIASRKKTEALLKAGYNVFMWPKSIGSKYKDFNEWCIGENINEIPRYIVDKNTLAGEYGLIKFKMLMNNI